MALKWHHRLFGTHLFQSPPILLPSTKQEHDQYCSATVLLISVLFFYFCEFCDHDKHGEVYQWKTSGPEILHRVTGLFAHGQFIRGQFAHEKFAQIDPRRLG